MIDNPYTQIMWTDLSTRHLLALRAVAEEGTFGRAAKRLGFTQSAVSQQIATLEQMVGQPLFDRPSGPRRPELTPAGELLLGHARKILALVGEAEIEVDQFARGVAGTFTVSVPQSVSSRVLPSALRELHQMAPEVDVQVRIEEGNELVQLENGELDLLCVGGEVPGDCDSVFLGSDPQLALVPAGHPPGPVKLEELSGRPMVGQPVGDVCNLDLDEALERLGVTPHYLFRSHDNGALQGMVGAGVGLALVPLLTINLDDPTVEIRPTEPEIPPRQLSLVWKRDRSLSPAATQFIEIMARMCDELLAATPIRAS